MKYLKNNKRKYLALAIGLFILVSVLFFQFLYTEATKLENDLNNIKGTVRTMDKTNEGFNYIVSINDTHGIISSLNSIITSVIFYLIAIILFGIYITYYLLKIYKKLKNLKERNVCEDC